MHTVDAEMYCEFDDEVSHRLGRHHVWAASGTPESRKVHQNQRAKLLDRGDDSAEGIDALRPRAGQEDGDAVGSATPRETNLEAADLRGGDVADIRKAAIHERFSSCCSAGAVSRRVIRSR